jgi:F0F1-type ATP synthase assembly protein I
MDLLGPEGRKQLKTGSRISALGLELGLSVALGATVGGWLDARWSTGPWILYAGLVLGLIAGLRSIFRFVRRTKLEQL